MIGKVFGRGEWWQEKEAEVFALCPSASQSFVSDGAADGGVAGANKIAISLSKAKLKKQMR